uniref:Uncharacterized protein n=1 Tax=Nelumbo nucifera TaxID=4432 RepID=A0A822YRH2_NELNU|nr:TPA_asm: hypothetical protein HUJ06_007435 [Nelumbo nucifera]
MYLLSLLYICLKAETLSHLSREYIKYELVLSCVYVA